MPEQRLPRYLDEQQERIAWEQKLAFILDATGEPMPEEFKGRRGQMIGSRSAEDDLARLRALPAIAPGVSGAIPHTDPLRELLRKERNGRRRR